MKPVCSSGYGSGGLSPCEIESVGEEFAVSGGDEDGSTGGLRFGLFEKGEDGGDCVGVESVFAVAG